MLFIMMHNITVWINTAEGCLSNLTFHYYQASVCKLDDIKCNLLCKNRYCDIQNVNEKKSSGDYNIWFTAEPLLPWLRGEKDCLKWST